MDYKASKAWHYGNRLSEEIHELVWQWPEPDQLGLVQKIRQASLAAPEHIARSLTRELHTEKIACYKASRQTLAQLCVHLYHAHRQHYLDKALYDDLVKKTVEVHKLLDTLIMSTEAE